MAPLVSESPNQPNQDDSVEQNSQNPQDETAPTNPSVEPDQEADSEKQLQRKVSAFRIGDITINEVFKSEIEAEIEDEPPD